MARKTAKRTTSKRPRDATATKEAILKSALIAFSRAGYDGVGLREIAGAAGVTAILVNRYFGSKDELFTAVVEVALSDDRLFLGDVSTLPKRVACAIVEKTAKDAQPVDALLLILRSAPNMRAAEILRKSIERHFERPLRDAMSGDATKIRAVLFLSVIAGYQLMRSIIASAALVNADQSVLSDRLEAVFRLLIDDGPGPWASSSHRRPAGTS